MNGTPEERKEIHTRLLKFALGADVCRDYWEHVEPSQTPVDARVAFEGQWFGSATESRVRVILSNMRVRFDAYPMALGVLSKWGHGAAPDTRRLICHWHLQFADPIYRRFTSSFLAGHRAGSKGSIERHQVIDWVNEQQPGRWKNPTLVQWASKLSSAAADAGLLDSKRGRRGLVTPDVPDVALSYICHLLRQVTFDGDILENVYLKSVGLDGRLLEDRLRRLDGVTLDRMGDLVDFRPAANSMSEWRGTLR